MGRIIDCTNKKQNPNLDTIRHWHYQWIARATFYDNPFRVGGDNNHSRVDFDQVLRGWLTINYIGGDVFYIS